MSLRTTVLSIVLMHTAYAITHFSSLRKILDARRVRTLGWQAKFVLEQDLTLTYQDSYKVA